MPGVAQRRTKLGGTWYDRGAVVPDEVITARTVSMGLVVSSSSAGTLSEATDAEVWAEALRRGLVSLDGTGYASTTEATPPGDSPDEVTEIANRFDPGAHKVDEVLAHVDANPDDLDRVLDAELGGKARKTLLDDLERRQGETDDTRDDTGGDAGGE